VTVEKKLIRKRGSARIESRGGKFAPTDTDLALIAKQVPEGWPAPTSEDVFIASALVCNNLVDHYSTRFTDEALAEIAELIVGTNIMRNHVEYGEEALPIGRVFAAEVVRITGQGERDGLYVRMWFYWERGTEFGDGMAKKIALGIWREVSLSWWMRSFTNSIDGKPFDESPYYAGQELPDGQVVVGVMADIVEVNEASIVPRGGQKNTSMNPARDGLASEDMADVLAASRARAEERGDPEPADGWGDFWKKQA
jgi:hypothetical protein